MNYRTNQVQIFYIFLDIRDCVLIVYFSHLSSQRLGILAEENGIWFLTL